MAKNVTDKNPAYGTVDESFDSIKYSNNTFGDYDEHIISLRRVEKVKIREGRRVFNGIDFLFDVLDDNRVVTKRITKRIIKHHGLVTDVMDLQFIKDLTGGIPLNITVPNLKLFEQQKYGAMIIRNEIILPMRRWNDEISG